VNRLRRLDLIARNFLQVNIVLNTKTPIIINETVSMSVEVLWSNIGGQLSLWLGVTIMTAVELFEFVYVLVKNIGNKRQKATKADSAMASDPGEPIRHQ